LGGGADRESRNDQKTNRAQSYCIKEISFLELIWLSMRRIDYVVTKIPRFALEVLAHATIPQADVAASRQRAAIQNFPSSLRRSAEPPLR